MINAYVDLTSEIYTGWSALGKLQSTISHKDVFLGNSDRQDYELLLGITIQILVDYLDTINKDAVEDNNYNKTVILQAMQSVISKLENNDFGYTSPKIQRL